MPEWTPELKDKVVKMYLAENPTPENSMEIVGEIAQEIEGATVNGVRAILVKAEVYVKKTPGKADADKPKGTRINKADAILNLKKILTKNDVEAADDIIDKLTGKAAAYFTSVVEQLVGDKED